MLIRLIKWTKGYLQLMIKDKDPERFFNLCRKRNIKIWNLSHVILDKSNEFYFYMLLADFKKIKQIVKKTRVRPKIVKRIGLPFFVQKYKKKHGFYIGLFISLATIYILSLFIWDINISGGHKYTEDIILRHLDDNNLRPGVLIKKIDAAEIERNIRNTYNDIGWVSAEIRGTRLIIKIKETNMPKTAVKGISPSHIVAIKEGEILDIITKKGTPLVKAGDKIKKGDILVSGLINVLSDFEEIISINQVVADADIRIKTRNNYKDLINSYYIKKQYTSKQKKGLKVIIFNNKINIYKPRNSYDKYDIIVSEKKIHITKNFYLPIKFHILNIREYEEVTINRSSEDIANQIKKNFNSFVYKLELDDKKMINNNINIKRLNDKYIIEGEYYLDEPAWDYQRIREDELIIDSVEE